MSTTRDLEQACLDFEGVRSASVTSAGHGIVDMEIEYETWVTNPLVVDSFVRLALRARRLGLRLRILLLE